MRGKDASQIRYISTQLMPIAHVIFKERDFPICPPKYDDGKAIEPEFFLPIIPMILVNDVDGVGNGWRTKIPSFHPKEIIANLRRLLNDKEVKRMAPWYRGFKGKIVRQAESPTTYNILGVAELDPKSQNWETSEDDDHHTVRFLLTRFDSDSLFVDIVLGLHQRSAVYDYQEQLFGMSGQTQGQGRDCSRP